MVELSRLKAVYGALVLVAATSIGAAAQSLTTIANFNSAGGANPFYMSLVQGTNGDFYGTAAKYGAHSYGAVFKVTSSGTLTSLHSFTGTDGANPAAGLVLAADGIFYGTTYQGGANSAGVVFRITADGTLTTLHSFDHTDGVAPYAGLIQAGNGDFYGTTEAGGSHSYGTIFKITSAGTLTTLLSFDGTNGAFPYAPLIQAANGDFYGTTLGGYGNVFKMAPGGVLTTLDSFNFTDGRAPYAGLVQATDGNIYGTTLGGGTVRYGTIFEVTPANTVTTLYNFCAQATCGQNPFAGLIQATDGNFYGTTEYGGTKGDGTIYRITPAGTATTLHSFDGTDGWRPQGGLVQGTDGDFYGTTTYGGTNGSCAYGCGTLFKLSVGLAPFVKTVPATGGVGSAIRILGTNLTGASSVTFNGTAAAFTVVAASEITTTVPTGATTGAVKVTAPGGILSSNGVFRVKP